MISGRRPGVARGMNWHEPLPIGVTIAGFTSTGCEEAARVHGCKPARTTQRDQCDLMSFLSIPNREIERFRFVSMRNEVSHSHPIAHNPNADNVRGMV